MNKNHKANKYESRGRGAKASVARFVYAAAMAILSSAALTACHSDGYDSGDGNYSYLTAQLATLHTNAQKAVTEATLDDGTKLQIGNPFTTNWATTPDSTYRALLYYDHNDDTSVAVRARSVTEVPVLPVMPVAANSSVRTDPIGLESAWMSRNGEYLNISLLCKAGSTSGDEAMQTVGMVCDSISTAANGLRTIHLRLYHDQGNVPEYYTVQRYVSVKRRSLYGADSVSLTVNTYKGKVVKQIAVAQ